MSDKNLEKVTKMHERLFEANKKFIEAILRMVLSASLPQPVSVRPFPHALSLLKWIFHHEESVPPKSLFILDMMDEMKTAAPQVFDPWSDPDSRISLLAIQLKAALTALGLCDFQIPEWQELSGVEYEEEEMLQEIKKENGGT